MSGKGFAFLSEPVVDEDVFEIRLQPVNHLLGDALELVRLEVLAHVVPGGRRRSLRKWLLMTGFSLCVSPLDEPPLAEGASVGLLPAVNLPVPVQRAGIRQLLSAHLARHHRLSIRTQLGVAELCNKTNSEIM